MSDSEEKEIPSVEKPVSEGESDVDRSDKEEEDEKIESDVKEDGNKKEDQSKKESQKSDGEDEEQSTAQKKSQGRKKKSKPEEEYDDDESDGEPRLGLLEQPVVIESGKREKKKVERLDMSGNSTPKEKKKVEIAEGAGEKLGDLPRVEYQLQKTKAEDLKHLHRFLFNRPGTANEIKKNIRQFSGFGFEKDDKEYEKKMANLNRNTTAVIKVMLEVLDLERKGTKEDIVDRMMTFCLSPKGSGKAVPKPKKRKSTGEKKGEKRKRKESKPKKEKKEKKPKKKKEDEEDEVDDKSDEEDEEKEDESEDEDEVEESESEEEEAPKKKKAKTAPPKKSSPKQEKKPPKKDTKKKSKPQKKKVESKSEESDLSESEDDSSDEEPLVKKKKNEPPTNDELKTLIKKILDKANLEELTMKSVIKQVHGKFPDFDLSDRKDFIKKTVRQLIT